jgi:hypothetical protein
MIDVKKKKEEIDKRLQEKVDSDEELKDIVEKAEELIKSTVNDGHSLNVTY